MKLAYTIALGPVYRAPVNRYPGDDRTTLNVTTEADAETARRRYRGRMLPVSRYGRGYFPLVITLNGQFYAVAGTPKH